jgi:drug/metabolite transporter (DMT)-like permease
MQSLWMLLAAFAFAIMGTCVKLASEFYSTAEIVFARGLFSVIAVYIAMRMQGGTLTTAYPKQHVFRGVIGVISQWLWFWSFTMLPVAMSTTLNYTSSIWIAAILFGIAWLRDKKPFEWGLAGTILLSFAGVALLLRPSIDPTQFFGGTVALTSSFVTAMVFLQVRKLGLMGEPEYRIVFYFSVICTLAGLLGCLYLGIVPFAHNLDLHGLMLILCLGASATVGQMTMTRAYRLGNPLVVSNLQYSGIVFTSIFGLMIWGDTMDWVGWVGITTILVSGMISTIYSQRASRAIKAAAKNNAA